MRMLSVQHLLGPVEEGEARASVRLKVDEASNLDARRGRAWPRVRGGGGRDPVPVSLGLGKQKISETSHPRVRPESAS